MNVWNGNINILKAGLTEELWFLFIQSTIGYPSFLELQTNCATIFSKTNFYNWRSHFNINSLETLCFHSPKIPKQHVLPNVSLHAALASYKKSEKFNESIRYKKSHFWPLFVQKLQSKIFFFFKSSKIEAFWLLKLHAENQNKSMH